MAAFHPLRTSDRMSGSDPLRTFDAPVDKVGNAGQLTSMSMFFRNGLIASLICGPTIGSAWYTMPPVRQATKPMLSMMHEPSQSWNHT